MSKVRDCDAIVVNLRLITHTYSCRKTAPVDATNFQQAKELTCPLGCGAHWCKQCNRTFKRGGIHSCDRQAEMNQLLGQQNWKKCPGVSPFLFSPPFPLTHTSVASQVPVEKGLWQFLHTGNSLLNCSVAQVCNHMTCRCNWYGFATI